MVFLQPLECGQSAVLIRAHQAEKAHNINRDDRRKLPLGAPCGHQMCPLFINLLRVQEVGRPRPAPCHADRLCGDCGVRI